MVPLPTAAAAAASGGLADTCGGGCGGGDDVSSGSPASYSRWKPSVGSYSSSGVIITIALVLLVLRLVIWAYKEDGFNKVHTYMAEKQKKLVFQRGLVNLTENLEGRIAELENELAKIKGQKPTNTPVTVVSEESMEESKGSEM